MQDGVRGKMKRAWAMAGLAVALLGAPGCVRSRVIVTSNPPGAVVRMNGANLGTTPIEQPFTWYWYYDFEARRDGYEPSQQRVRFVTPLWLVPPLDLVMELMPFRVRDTKRVHFDMVEAGSRPAPGFAPADLFPESPETPGGGPADSSATPAIDPTGPITDSGNAEAAP